MSLKVFHIVFIVLTVSLAVFCSIWAFTSHASVVFAVGSALAAILMFVYGIWFFRKAKNIIT